MVILSPAKKLSEEHYEQYTQTKPRFSKETKELAEIMQSYDPADLQNLMHISPKLAELNYNRYQAWKKRPNSSHTNPAMFAFRGDVFVGLDPDDMSTEEVHYAQDHLRILSGLYGLLRPLDGIQDYRLEMGTQLKTSKGKNLYDYWGGTLTKQLKKDIKESGDKYLYNLASQEYDKVINMDDLGIEIIDFGFKERRNDKWMFISYNAKRARGLVARYILDNRITDKDSVKHFDVDGYSYNEELSEGNKIVFTR